ncbi:putative transposase-like DNA-binding protein [Rhodococcus sp. SMB37]|nr:putative transposase-like DNA-binding protein [Rhodococcus sp. SMB37]
MRALRSHAGGARKAHNTMLALADAALAQIRRMLGYKTRWYGSVLVEADRYFPSSKMCSGCGRRKPNLTLADRMYVCEHCGVTIDRDRNAAINLARLGETHRTGDTGTGTGSSPAATDSGGDGRGATQESATTPVVNAAGDEASTRHDDTVGETGTVSPEGEAA